MNVFDFRDRVVNEYESFSRSFSRFRSEDIKSYIETTYLSQRFTPPPLIQLNQFFVLGRRIDQLVQQGVLEQECVSIFKARKKEDPPGITLSLHVHQDEVIQRAQQGSSYVLTTGTGSGKSLSYFIPIVDAILKEKKSGQSTDKRIRAIVIYPMNALCNSQLEELEMFLVEGYPKGGSRSPSAIRAFGGQEDVQRFVLTTAERLNAPLEKIRNHYKFPLAYLPASLQEQLQLSGFKGNIKLSFKHPDQSAVEHVHRTHPIVIALADYVAEQTLAERDSQLTSRCGALFTRQVAKRTTILLLRLRNQIVVSYRNKKQVLLAEECLAVAVTGSAAPQLMDEADAVALMSAEPSKNMEAAFRKRVIAEALDILPSLQSTFNGIAEGRARDLRDDHRRVREASAGKGLEYEVKPCVPVDVIGVYVLQPDAGL